MEGSRALDGLIWAAILIRESRIAAKPEEEIKLMAADHDPQFFSQELIWSAEKIHSLIVRGNVDRAREKLPGMVDDLDALDELLKEINFNER